MFELVAKGHPGMGYHLSPLLKVCTFDVFLSRRIYDGIFANSGEHQIELSQVFRAVQKQTRKLLYCRFCFVLAASLLCCIHIPFKQ